MNDLNGTRPIEHRILADMAVMVPPEDTTLSFVETPQGRIELMPPIPLKKDTHYRIQLWTDGTVSLWELIADGQIGQVQ